MSWLRTTFHSSRSRGHSPGPSRIVQSQAYLDGSRDAPPEWQPAPEQVHTYGLHAEATDEDYEAAEAFCQRHAPDPPRLLSSDAIDRIRRLGCGAWQLQRPTTPRFRGVIQNLDDSKDRMGVIRVATASECQDVCILSDFPILAGLYDTRGKPGVYYEVRILRMDGVIAIGTASRPYPNWRLPGWNRLSAGLHLDDCRKFFEDANGGRDYAPGLASVSPGDTVGLGYEWALGSVFFTHNGRRLPDAFTGIYLPREWHDVYAAIGVAGPGVCEFEVNFGAGPDFEWKEGNSWKVQAHVGMMPGGLNGEDNELPSYSDVGRDRRVLT